MGIENIILGFHVAITPYNLMVAVIGISLGTIIGVLPGLGGANGVAILLPLTFPSFVGLGGSDPLKSIVSIALGFILAAVGLDIVTGQLRLTFGLTPLMTGFDFIVAVIGLFGIGEILLSVEQGLKFEGARTK